MTVHEVDRIHRAKTDAYVRLCSLAWASTEQRHRRNPPETAEQRDEMDARLVAARAHLREAWGLLDAVDEASRSEWAQWVNGGRQDNPSVDLDKCRRGEQMPLLDVA